MLLSEWSIETIFVNNQANSNIISLSLFKGKGGIADPSVRLMF